MKDLVLEQDGLPLWDPAVRLEFPIPTRLVERELLERLALNQVLQRQRYTQEELLEELAEARRNIAVVPVQKRRRLLEIAGCRAESGEVLVAGRRLLTAAAEHETPDALRRAVGEMKLARYPNLDYAGADRCTGRPEAGRQAASLAATAATRSGCASITRSSSRPAPSGARPAPTGAGC